MFHALQDALSALFIRVRRVFSAPSFPSPADKSGATVPSASSPAATPLDGASADLIPLAALPARNRLLDAANMPGEALFRLYETSPSGLASGQLEAMRTLFGFNTLSTAHKTAMPRRLAASFADPFTAVLMLIAAISFVTDYILVPPAKRDLSAVFIIIGMVLLSGLMRFVQESRSDAAAEKLKAMVRTTIAVERDGELRENPIGELAVGDIIRLAAGDMLPADVRVLETRDLFVSQSALTGESEPVEKLGAPLSEARSNPLDCPNLAFMGSNVISGSALALVLAVGNDTLFGGMARELSKAGVPTGFDRGISAVSWLLIRFMLGMVPVVLLLNGFTKGDWFDAVLFALSVAVGLTPEMLPMLVTANLAKSAVAMSRRKVIVKRLGSIQNLGAMDVLCTDKTGTLTQDRIILEYSLDVHGQEDERVLRHAFLNSYHQTGLKNLMDAAIINHADEKSMIPLRENYRKIDEIPFDFIRRRMSVLVADPSGKTQMITKGAVEEMLTACSHAEFHGEVEPLSDALREEILSTVRRYNENGMRVIAVAHKSFPNQPGNFGAAAHPASPADHEAIAASQTASPALSSADEADMVLLGYLAFLDPPKESAGAAIQALRAHGVRVKVLTGDNEAVTRSVCRQVGLISDREGDPVLTGADMEALDDDALAAAAENADIFAKLSPAQKSRLVACLRRNGHTVGFMGDGINDAAAMKASDVGISVDSAVDVARESADVILLEKDLMVLEQGVLEGRRTYANIIKYIKMTISSNFGNMFSVLVASALLPFLPMQPVQILALNFIYDLSCLALPWDNVDADFLKKPRTWDASTLTRFMVRFGPTSSIFDIATYALMYFVLCPALFGGPYASLDPEHQAAFAAVFQAGWFVESLWTQTLVIHMLRTPRIPFLQSRASWQVSMFNMAGIAVGTMIPFSFLGPAMEMGRLPGVYFPWLAAILVAYMALVTWCKATYIRRYGELL